MGERRLAEWSRRFRAYFEGSAPSLPLSLARIALAGIALIRSTDLGRGVVPFNHHTWMKGVEYAPYVDPVTAPGLVSPLVPGLSLSPLGSWLLVGVRTASAVTLLFGLRARASAALFAASGLWLMAADRYRYLHHLYLLFTMSAWFALVPSDERLSLERWLRRGPGRAEVPRWSLQLLRLYCASVYFASGVAKLRSSWLSGETLRDLERVTLIGGPLWEHGVAAAGYSAIAWSVCATELSLGPLLLVRRTRLLGVALGVLLHGGVMATMEVSTFSAQMLLLLALFLIADRPAR